MVVKTVFTSILSKIISKVLQITLKILHWNILHQMKMPVATDVGGCVLEPRRMCPWSLHSCQCVRTCPITAKRLKSFTRSIYCRCLNTCGGVAAQGKGCRYCMRSREKFMRPCTCNLYGGCALLKAFYLMYVDTY